LRKLVKLIINSIIGILLLFLINQIGETWNFHIGIKIFTTLFVRDFRNTGSNIISDIKAHNIEKDKLEFEGELL